MDKTKVGETLRQLRTSKGLSQTELGKILGYSHRTVSDWENGKTEPNINAFKAIVKFFDITYEEFFGDI